MGVYRIEVQSKKGPFTGWVFEEDTGLFYGIAKKQSKAGPEIKYLTGEFTPYDEGGLGVEIYEISNTPGDIPIKYVAPDLENPGIKAWAEYSHAGIFRIFKKKKREIKIKVMRDSDKKRHFIEKLFEKLDMEANFNGFLIYELMSYGENIFSAL